MLYLHISYREKSEGDWDDLLVSGFQSFGKLYPEERCRKDSYGIKQSVITPCGHSYDLTAYFSLHDNLVNYQFEQDGKTLLSNSSYKKSLESFDPSVNLRLPNGSYLAITFSSLKEVEAM
jgi:hypothetical protein